MCFLAGVAEHVVPQQRLFGKSSRAVLALVTLLGMFLHVPPILPIIFEFHITDLTVPSGTIVVAHFVAAILLPLLLKQIFIDLNSFFVVYQTVEIFLFQTILQGIVVGRSYRGRQLLLHSLDVLLRQGVLQIVNVYHLVVIIVV